MPHGIFKDINTPSEDVEFDAHLPIADLGSYFRVSPEDFAKTKTIAQQREFLADAAHELRTPIARLRARVEVALLAPAPTSDTSVLRAIDHELRAVSQHVDELLQLARADAAGDEAAMREESLFLDDVIADELPRWQPEAQRRRMTLDYSALEESPVVGDAALLPRLVSILVDNAIRYIHEGGTVRVRVRLPLATT